MSVVFTTKGKEMEQYFQVAKESPLFTDFSSKDFSSIFTCLGAFIKKYEKKEVIFLAGDKINHIGLVISGSVKIIQEDNQANESILTEVGVGDTFAEIFACSNTSCSPVTAITREKSEILFLDYHKILNICSNSCVFHRKLIDNLLKMIAHKCLILNEKVTILSKRNIREKIFSFLQYMGKGEKKVKIEFNREEMANFICVDRSALSAELSKMQKEGILLYHKNEFQIL